MFLFLQLETRLNQIKTFKKIKEEKVEFWRDLLTKFLLSGKYVAVRVLRSLHAIIMYFEMTTWCTAITEYKILMRFYSTI